MERAGYRNGRDADLWTLAHVASLIGVLAVLVYVCRGQWFFGDEWDFILRRGFHHAPWGFFRPHNEHWSTIPIVWYRAVFGVFGLRTYWPYMAGLFATHLVVVHCGWRLMRRANVNAALAFVVALIMGLFGAGSENLIWAFQVGFVGSLAAGLLLILAVDEAGGSRRVALVALGAIAMLMLSGISVVMVGAVGLAALARWGWRRAAIVVAPAALTYLVWLKVYGTVGLHGGTGQFHGGPSDIPRYVWGGISDTLGVPLHSRRVGEVLLVVLIAAVVVKGRAWWRDAPEVLALAAAAPVMFAVISQGRGAIQDPSAGRYLYLCAGMLLPLIAYALNALTGERRVFVAIAVVACLAVTASGVDILRDSARYERGRELTLKGQMLAALQVGTHEPVISDTPDFMWATDVRIADLQRLAVKHNLPNVAFTVRDIAQARLALQLNTELPLGVDPGSGIGVLPPEATTRPDPASSGVCRYVDLHGGNFIVRQATPNTDVSFVITPTATDYARAFVPYDGGFAGPRLFAVTAGKKVRVKDAAAGDVLFQLPAGDNVICGLTWPTS